MDTYGFVSQLLTGSLLKRSLFFSIICIGIALFPVLNASFYYDRQSKRAAILSELAGIDVSKLPAGSPLRTVYQELTVELAENNPYTLYQGYLCKVPHPAWWTWAVKFIAGGFFFWLLVFMDARSWGRLLVCCLANTAIPLFTNPLLNYLLFPALLSMSVLIGSDLYYKLKKTNKNA